MIMVVVGEVYIVQIMKAIVGVHRRYLDTLRGPRLEKVGNHWTRGQIR